MSAVSPPQPTRLRPTQLPETYLPIIHLLYRLRLQQQTFEEDVLKLIKADKTTRPLLHSPDEISTMKDCTELLDNYACRMVALIRTGVLSAKDAGLVLVGTRSVLAQAEREWEQVLKSTRVATWKY